MSSRAFIILAGPSPVHRQAQGAVRSLPWRPPLLSQCGRGMSLVPLDLHLCVCVSACWSPCVPAGLPSYRQLFPLCTRHVFLRCQVFHFGFVWFFFLSDSNPILQIVYSSFGLIASVIQTVTESTEGKWVRTSSFNN